MQDPPKTLHGPWCLWDGVPMLLATPLRYLLLVIVLPAAAVAVFASPPAAAQTFVGGILFMWLFQFYFFR